MVLFRIPFLEAAGVNCCAGDVSILMDLESGLDLNSLNSRLRVGVFNINFYYFVKTMCHYMSTDAMYN